ncbi:MAG: thioredoxin family protein [Candidatus Melainabacteria bacterium]|nr:MAG: thioredoxin family protein [Candidatus Melainabacteria bacterium]
MNIQKRVAHFFSLVLLSSAYALPSPVLYPQAAGALPEATVVCGKPAPQFTLTDTNGKVHKLSDYKGKFVVLEWFNQGCPFVKKHYGSGNMQRMQKEYTEKGVVWLSICSSAPGKQGNYSPQEHNAMFKEKEASPTAILLDPEGTVGRLYDAKTTPDMFVINPKGILIYSGAIDDQPDTDPSSILAAHNYVRQALDQALAGASVKVAVTKSYGCSVKYR